MDRYIAAPAAFLTLLVTSACGGPTLVPVLQNGQLVPQQSDAVIAQAQLDGETERRRITDERAGTTTFALASCVPAICDAIARGELSIGMSEAQVLAATRTTLDAWDSRSSGGATLMTGRSGTIAPGDAVGEIAFVNLQNGSVAAYTYRDPQGFRTVVAPADATLAGRADDAAAALLQQGDDLAAAGRLDLALERYDRADVIRPGDAETNLRIASTLDKQLRPIEALLRYQLFIHQLEIEKIEARGDAAAKMAEAIARARERVIVLDRQ